MYRIFTILLLAGSVHSQSLQDTINRLFPPPNSGSLTTTTTTTSTTSTTSTAKPAISEIEPTKFVPPPNVNYTTCIFNGTDGLCVPHYLCNSNNTIKTDGEDVIDLRGGDGPCTSYIDVCCSLPDQRPPTDPILPTTDPLKPQRQGCGWANPDGVGMKTTGETDGETKFGEFPWMVAILKYQPDKENDANGLKIYFGGGSLIHPSVVLTAAHVVANKPQLSIRAGEWDTQTTKEIYPHQDREVQSIAVHKDFNAGILFYDVALLFLKSPINMAPNVGLVCLPPHAEMAYTETRCFASGWGKKKFEKENEYQVILKKVEVPVIDHRVCETRLRTTKLGNIFELHSSFMCAGGETGKDTCKGDGGSPLVCPVEYEKDRYIQYGIVAWGIGCGDTGIPGVYVDVSKVRNWIDDKVRGKRYLSDVYTY